MEDSIISHIEATVLSLLERLTHLPSGSISLSSDVVKELRIDSDDLSFLFIPEVERTFDIKIPPQEWRRVHTVYETVELIKSYITKKASA